ncbi:hypothetical protein TrVE_jg10374 [Triparma verrucosa]|uniref:Uncharacterized protein n=1 Tax=Triparma verrucosa TaxID=1606542 RepID=A0A9W7FHU1_9STRA|nr:hypothetical protein TrVE_jg10374 [Triparma verrucosa]
MDLLSEMMLLQSRLQESLSDSLTEVTIVSNLVEGGSGRLVENVGIIRREIEEGQNAFDGEMTKLEQLLERFDSYIDSPFLSSSTRSLLLSFRHTVISPSFELVHLDVSEPYVSEKLDSTIRRQHLTGSSTSYESTIESLLEASRETIEGLKAEIAATANDLSNFEIDLKSTGLDKALNHYRTLRDTFRNINERNGIIRMHQERLERELECLDAGVYDNIEGGEDDKREEGRDGDDGGGVINESVMRGEIKERIHGNPHPESIWGIILRLFLGFDYDEEGEGEGKGGVIIV